MKKLVLTMVVIILAGISFFVYNKSFVNDSKGDITIVLVDSNKEIMKSDTFSFSQEDKLLEILTKHYEVSCANSNYTPTTCDQSSIFGTVLLEIDDLKTDWKTSYIAIYVNDTYSTNGIDHIMLHDGDVYRFEYTLIGGDSQ